MAINGLIWCTEYCKLVDFYLIYDETQGLLSNISIDSNLGQPKVMFDQHQGADGVRVETCMSDEDGVIATRENAFNHNC
jgi:hypothetical protein